MKNLKRSIKFYPAWDKRNPDPKKDYGIHGVEIQFWLTGPKGGISWGIYTDWLLDSVLKDKKWPGFKDTTYRKDGTRSFPMGVELAYHSPKPTNKWQKEKDGTLGCQLLPKGKKCWGDAGFIAGGDLMKVLIEKGEEAVWKEMESWYKNYLK